MRASFHDIAGFLGACLVDSESGLTLMAKAGGPVDLEAAATFSTQIAAAKLRVMSAMGLNEKIENVLITQADRIHFIRPLEKAPGVILYVCLERKAARLGMALMQVERIERDLFM
ncbi:hypothetical protein [Rubellimicrobium mesophilum]|nr:hypothetical protein [Rubellimicrobium mesophilum]